ncbi:hypothetical protein SESBI_23019 [Sesbania bispinosa]|nr:hypothetical protein SESBI_23019 [Sesbania bispinosa]
MPKTGDSFVSQMVAKAMKAFMSSTTISDKPIPKKICTPADPASAVEEITHARLANTELEGLRKKLEDHTLEKEKLKNDLANSEKEKEKSDTLLEQRSTLLKETEEKLRVSEKKLATEQVGRKTDTDNLKAEITFQYETGFEKAVEQIKFLYLELNM